MGQYYHTLLLDGDKRYVWSPADCKGEDGFRSGLKLTEHSWMPNRFVALVMCNLINAPKRVAWMGQYADDDPESTTKPYGHGFIKEDDPIHFMDFYNMVWKDDAQEATGVTTPPITKVEQALAIDFSANRPWDGWYLINVSKKLYIDLSQYADKNTAPKGHAWAGWCVHPLPLLTAIGNGNGGGDYCGYEEADGYCVGMEDVGSWAFDIIYVSQKKPGVGYDCETHYEFREWARPGEEDKV